MKYQALCIDEIQKCIEQKVKELSDLLQLDIGKCLVLLLTYGWNEHKLLDDYVNCKEQSNLLLEHGIYDPIFLSAIRVGTPLFSSFYTALPLSQIYKIIMSLVN